MSPAGSHIGESPVSRPDRVLVATVLSEDTSHLMARWQARLVLQETSLLWDVLVVEATESPSADYWNRLAHWAKAWPFGSGHKVRMLHRSIEPWAAVTGKFDSWRSYDCLFMVEIHSVIAVDAMQRLSDSRLPKTGGAGCLFLRAGSSGSEEDF